MVNIFTKLYESIQSYSPLNTLFNKYEQRIFMYNHGNKTVINSQLNNTYLCINTVKRRELTSICLEKHGFNNKKHLFIPPNLK